MYFRLEWGTIYHRGMFICVTSEIFSRPNLEYCRENCIKEPRCRAANWAYSLPICKGYDFTALEQPGSRGFLTYMLHRTTVSEHWHSNVIKTNKLHFETVAYQMLRPYKFRMACRGGRYRRFWWDQCLSNKWNLTTRWNQEPRTEPVGDHFTFEEKYI